MFIDFNFMSPFTAKFLVTLYIHVDLFHEVPSISHGVKNKNNFFKHLESAKLNKPGKLPPLEKHEVPFVSYPF